MHERVHGDILLGLLIHGTGDGIIVWIYIYTGYTSKYTCIKPTAAGCQQKQVNAYIPGTWYSNTCASLRYDTSVRCCPAAIPAESRR